MGNNWQMYTDHYSTLPYSLTGPCRATSFHPWEPHSQNRWGSAAALSVRRLHGHTPAPVRQLPAYRWLTAHTPTERPCVPLQASRTCSECEGGWGCAGEAGQGAGKHVHPPSCRSSSGNQQSLHSAADGNTWWAQCKRNSSECHSVFIKLLHQVKKNTTFTAAIFLDVKNWSSYKFKNSCLLYCIYRKFLPSTKPLALCWEQDVNVVENKLFICLFLPSVVFLSVLSVQYTAHPLLVFSFSFISIRAKCFTEREQDVLSHLTADLHCMCEILPCG